MKKLIAITLIFVLALCCTGCAGQTAEKEGGGPTVVNPLEETDAKGIMDKIGVEFNVPEGAKDLQYFVVNKELAEMRFTLNGVNCTARIKPTAAFEDISGMYYQWTEESAGKVSYNDAKVYKYSGDNYQIAACMWCDMAPGISYSVVAEGEDLSGIDIVELSTQVYKPMQGDVG